MNFASVCSGIGAPEVAWSRLGWSARWCSEIEAFPSAVLEARFASPNLGDMTSIDAAEVLDEHGSIDVLVGGTPCQSFSVAGLRAGLRDDRGNLARRFVELARDLRPRWMVWENVPGVLSSNNGRDFGAILGGLEECGYGWAYRTLDAQFFRVAQRRRRVFVVGCLGGWQRASAVLFERSGLRGDPPPIRTEGPAAVALTASGAGEAGLDQARGEQIVVFETLGNLNPGASSVDVARTLIATHHPITSGGVSLPLDTSGASLGVLQGAPRRLTPRECERLQGFPDDWTAIEHRGRPAKDAPRYRAIGNSMAVPVMEWIGRRIELVSRVSTLPPPPSPRRRADTSSSSQS